MNFKKKYYEISKKITKEISSNKLTYITLFIVLSLAFFVRVYRINQLLGFFYDQGRDALVIWKLWHEGKFFLIGPTTGLAGIFLGPLYYYLIAPFYFLGGGNPVFPSVFLSLLTVFGILIIYYTGAKHFSRLSGLLAAVLASFSFNIVYLSRWLSNPTPIFLSSAILVLSLVELAQYGNKKWWIVIAFLVGISLQFEAASAFFYIPVIVVFGIWQLIIKGKSSFPSLKISLISIFVFVVLLIPQITFNFRHDNILINGFSDVFINSNQYRVSFWNSLKYRSGFYWASFSNKIIPESGDIVALIFMVLGIQLVTKFRILGKHNIFVVLLIFITIPLLFYAVFQGNYGQLFDYYLMGYYMPFLLLFSIILSSFSRHILGKFLIIIFIGYFLLVNGRTVKNYITTGLDGPSSMLLQNQMDIIDWVFREAQGEKFNVDVYVPPVISYSYDYLFLWQGSVRCGNSLCGLEKDSLTPLLFTIYEADFPHPDRLNGWLERQKGIGKVSIEYKSGGVTSQKRERL